MSKVLLLIDFSAEQILINANSMTLALRTAWASLINKYDENGSDAVERFLEEHDTATADDFIALKKSCRDYGYKWTELFVKKVTELTLDDYNSHISKGELTEIKSTW